MKKTVKTILMALLCLGLFLGCTKCSASEPLQFFFRGKIAEITGTSAIVIPNQDEKKILLSGDKVKIDLSVSKRTFAVGDEVVVFYTGEIMESYPLQIVTLNLMLASEY